MGKRILIDPYDIRLHMATLGWQSNDAIAENGTYTISFYRYDWQGVPVSQVSFYGRTHDLGKINETVARAGRLALRAWKDFPDDVPTQPNPDSEKLEIRQRLERDGRGTTARFERDSRRNGTRLEPDGGRAAARPRS